MDLSDSGTVWTRRNSGRTKVKTEGQDSEEVNVEGRVTSVFQVPRSPVRMGLRSEGGDLNEVHGSWGIKGQVYRRSQIHRRSGSVRKTTSRNGGYTSRDPDSHRYLVTPSFSNVS